VGIVFCPLYLTIKIRLDWIKYHVRPMSFGMSYEDAQDKD